MSHDDLVVRAVRWLAGTQRCGVVLSELTTSAYESPDAIGWRMGGRECVYIECKATLPDFYADKRKVSRRVKSLATGNYRYYFTPPGLLRPENLPEHWGLIEVEGRCRVVVKATRQESNCRQEVAMLYSAALRWANGHVHVFAVPEAAEAAEGGVK